ncbi:hypothetical protein, partial [Nocardia brasiliensis]|uniref:hypothetical protein n=1 Tax=Nocardia brasiliensis TaxID=37326 RepID=UPI002455F3F3
VEDMSAVCDRTVHLRSGRLLATESATDVAPIPKNLAPHPDPHPAGPSPRCTPRKSRSARRPGSGRTRGSRTLRVPG